MEKERDELKGQLQETERKLHERTCRVVELEHNLEEVATDSLKFPLFLNLCLIILQLMPIKVGNARNEEMK